ncbi:phage portal protein [Siminovitchia sp. FSL W7-1587]|uniref:phage portal protein n=1 Tax=Siminovitchia sp. FSL W7-1587 TaxID=2954699 RepID=UPI0030D5C89E
MAKINEFETATYAYSSKGKRRFSPEANMHYRYSSADELIKNTESLSEIIQHHMQHQVPRLKTLRNYYEAENETILRNNRRREEHLADHRAIHAFGEYVSNFMQGYMVGIPLKTQYPDDDINEKIRDMNRTNDADEHNSDLVLDQSIYGRAYELLYRSRQDEIRFSISDVLETFVIYDETIERNPVAGVRYIKSQFKDDVTVYLYTSDVIITYALGDDFKLTHQDEVAHAFKGVPIIEYENNKFRRGDFERVLNLIDLYDEAQSDTSNYMSDFNDAMLKIVGNLDIDAEEAKEMKKNNILMLQTEPDAEGRHSQADADYIYKKYDVQGTEAYKDRIKNDIHMFTHTPNTDDEKFSGNQSGEALKYKLFGLELKRSTKERLFKKSLRDRYRLINNIMSIAAEGSFDVNEISIIFTPNLPKSLKDEIEAFVKLGGDLSDETKLSMLSIIENPQEELEKIKNENPQTKAVSYDFPKQDDDDEQEEEVTDDE